jgi:hypothetical protein
VKKLIATLVLAGFIAGAVGCSPSGSGTGAKPPPPPAGGTPAKDKDKTP